MTYYCISSILKCTFFCMLISLKLGCVSQPLTGNAHKEVVTGYKSQNLRMHVNGLENKFHWPSTEKPSSKKGSITNPLDSKKGQHCMENQISIAQSEPTKDFFKYLNSKYQNWYINLTCNNNNFFCKRKYIWLHLINDYPS